MSQPTESQSPSTIDAPSEADVATLVESYADDLMDTLFENVDQLLEGDEAAIKSVLNPPPEPEPAVSPPKAVEAPLVPLISTLDFPAPEPEAPEPGPQPSWLQRHLTQILIGAGVVATAGIAGLGFLYQQQNTATEVATGAPAVDAQAQADAEFLQYLQRSLEVINAQAEATAAGETPPAVDIPQVPVLPSAQIPGRPVPTSPTPGGGPINVIERVYVPYQPIMPTAPTAANPAPEAARPSGQTGTAPANPTTTAARPAANHMLMGVLELGERSAALFEIDGVPQRVGLGGRIGESGWTLVSVSNEEAVIRRNGEVRSIYIGQQF